MITNEKLEKLCLELEKVKVDFPGLVLKFRQHSNYDSNKYLSYFDYERAFRDNFTRYALSVIKDNGLNIERLNVKSKNLIWKYDEMERAFLYKKPNGKKFKKRGLKNTNPIALYENVLSVDGVPTVLRSCIANSIRWKRIIKDKKILKNTFGENFSYIIFSPKDFFVNKYFARFEEENGLIAQFPMSKNEFRTELKGVLDKYKFKVGIPKNKIEKTLKRRA